MLLEILKIIERRRGNGFLAHCWCYYSCYDNSLFCLDNGRIALLNPEVRWSYLINKIEDTIVKKIVLSIKEKPVNLILIIMVLCLYLLNNKYLKPCTEGIIQQFFICYFNDLICPLLFISYSNMLLISINKEIKRFKWIMFFGFCSGLVWEFIAPLLNPMSVTDIVDLLFYTLGAFFYWGIIKGLSLWEKKKLNDKTANN